MASTNPKRRRHRRSFGAIRELPSNKFQASFKDLSGEIHLAPQTFATREAADKFLAIKQGEQIAEQEAQSSGRWLLDRNRGAITLGEYLEKYLETKEDWSEGTRELNERLAKNYIFKPVENNWLADKRLDGISPLMVREWFAAVQRATFESSVKVRTPKPLNNSAAAKLWAKSLGLPVEPLGKVSSKLLGQWQAAGSPQLRQLRVAPEASPAGRVTAAKAYALLKQVFNTAIYDELIDRNPAKDKNATLVRSRSRKAATIEQVEALALAVPPRYRAAVLLAAYSGLRQGELYGLARKHFNFAAKSVEVERSVKKRQGKAAYLGTTKTAGSVRLVILPETIAEALQAHLEIFTGADPEALIFPTSQGNLVTSSALSDWYIPAREKAGLPELTWHELRHTGATMAASTGASLTALMARLGHTSVRAALHYQKLTATDDAQIAKGIEAKIAGAKLYALDDFREATA
jgi:integrase